MEGYEAELKHLVRRKKAFRPSDFGGGGKHASVCEPNPNGDTITASRERSRRYDRVFAQAMAAPLGSDAARKALERLKEMPQV